MNPHFEQVAEYAEELPSGQFQYETEWGFAIRSSIVTNDPNDVVTASVGTVGRRGAFHIVRLAGPGSRLRTLASMAMEAERFAGHIERCRQAWLDAEHRPAQGVS